MITCTFAGHRAALSAADEAAIPEALAAEIAKLLEHDEEFRFYFGGMGWFDIESARAVRRAKRAANAKRIEMLLIQPYARKVEEPELYDEIIVPAELANLHPKAAIPARNRYLIEHSEILIAYVRREGGAAATLRNAAALGRSIVRI